MEFAILFSLYLSKESPLINKDLGMRLYSDVKTEELKKIMVVICLHFVMVA